ncbi:MAG: phage tail terminator-like protein [Shewanella sp.]
MFNSIPAALIAHYRAGGFFTDARTALPNAAFTKPGPTIAWASVFVIPARTGALSLTGSDDMSGILQIDLNYPLNGGAGAAQLMAQNIRAHFKRGTRVQGVYIGAVSYTPFGAVDGWYRGVVSVDYRAIVGV